MANHVAKWDGVSWSPFDSGLTVGSLGAPLVHALATFDDGQGPALWAGGNFNMAGGTPVKHLAKWNGSCWSDRSGGVNPEVVDSLHPYNDGTCP